ncbi:multicopper oxidase family protein [Spongiactinospora sp. TRM90649]|uniref:multicopper oxidase family protein n=1 Tax=Spongiactinospora sp. TRM90649 TaxID=3031114 RepID=UPI0023F65C4A|nr:multicopper oxidase family protein [Spongiactinospora sp. TRM90649]MDF5753050.1 multicopper oxidase family protein [Spongiactinospora sp. TRM90649]
MLNRRNMLALGGLTGASILLPPDAAVAALAPDGDPARRRRGSRPDDRVHVPPFSVEMPLPPVARPVAVRRDADVYRIRIRNARVEVVPRLLTPVMSFGGGFVGPTIMARTGRKVIVKYRNELDEPANVHVHGLHVPASSDGHPMDVIQPGGVREYVYPNGQQGATLWYHDHSHHTEAQHVYAGLHGFYLIHDPSERRYGLPSGRYDVPIMIRDALITPTGKLAYDVPDTRNMLLANGRPQPYFRVAARKYRFRLLNGTTHRLFRLNLGGVPMIQIGSDGGLLPAPQEMRELLISSGERADVVVDFGRFRPGRRVVMYDTSGAVMCFDVVHRVEDPSRVPDELRPLPDLPEPTVTRDVVFDLQLTPPQPKYLMNDQVFDHDRVDFRVRRGTTEIWRIHNADVELGGINHTFHLHLEQFRVLDRDGAAPWPSDRGRKDTIYVPPGQSARVKVRFTEYLGKYVYHCHFLDHSSLGMMAQLEVVP